LVDPVDPVEGVPPPVDPVVPVTLVAPCEPVDPAGVPVGRTHRRRWFQYFRYPAAHPNPQGRQPGQVVTHHGLPFDPTPWQTSRPHAGACPRVDGSLAVGEVRPLLADAVSASSAPETRTLAIAVSAKALILRDPSSSRTASASSPSPEYPQAPRLA
jgi:hypothetical protein